MVRAFWRPLVALLLASAPVASEAQAAVDAVLSVAQQKGGAVDVVVQLDEATLRALIDGARWAASSLVAYLIGRSQPIPSGGVLGRLFGASPTLDAAANEDEAQ
jgi:hypothetical protein